MAENFVGLGGGGLVEHVATMSNLNPSYLELLWVELSQVELGLGFDNYFKISITVLQRLIYSATTLRTFKITFKN